MILDFRHSGLVVSNIEDAKKFYVKILKLKIVDHLIEKGNYFSKLIGLKNKSAEVLKIGTPDGKYIEIICFKNQKKKNKKNNFDLLGSSHICFTVKNIDKFCKKLEKSNIEFISKPLQSDFDNVKTCFCYDFDNNLIQFVEGGKDFKSRK